MNERLKNTLVTNTLKWAGYAERIGDGKLATMSRRPKSGGRGRRGKSSLGWEDCIKRDIKRVGNEQTNLQKNWRLLLENKVT